ncbi:hypothetical protein [Hydrogenophaga sp. BPS33]|uniref:hypothetical protein n=1 Tax=Hydrogenophaga sp. BPS33 TaxID=2651974 RepID=UPI00131FC9A9|nr:hypothetical protein [Hydrogenophaga sp. BPS33]QHE85491.1 hypothetical protein F9K07_11565 [Hydrogenophaga sp. BPS33]
MDAPLIANPLQHLLAGRVAQQALDRCGLAQQYSRHRDRLVALARVGVKPHVDAQGVWCLASTDPPVLDDQGLQLLLDGLDVVGDFEEFLDQQTARLDGLAGVVPVQAPLFCLAVHDREDDRRAVARVCGGGGVGLASRGAAPSGLLLKRT